MEGPVLKDISAAQWPSNIFNPLPDDNILGLPKFKAFADDKLNVTEKIQVVFHRIENIAGTSIFFFSNNVFKGIFPLVRQKSSLCGKGLIPFIPIPHFQPINFRRFQNESLQTTISNLMKLLVGGIGV